MAVGFRRCFGTSHLFLTPPSLHQKTCKLMQVICLPRVKWVWNDLKIKRYQCFFLKINKIIQEQKQRRKTASWLIKFFFKNEEKLDKGRGEKRDKGRKKKRGKKENQVEQSLPPCRDTGGTHWLSLSVQTAPPPTTTVLWQLPGLLYARKGLWPAGYKNRRGKCD